MSECSECIAQQVENTERIPILPPLDANGSPVMDMAHEVMWDIGRTIASHHAESGGVLGTRRGELEVTHYHYDSAGSRSRVTYAPDVPTINALLGGAWEHATPSVDLLGCIHSHPPGSEFLSQPDLRYIARLLELNSDMGVFFAPIVLPDSQRLIPWIVYRDRPWHPVRARLRLI